jgi:hypothetical protein
MAGEPRVNSEFTYPPSAKAYRRRWKTRIELADAIFEYLEIFHNRRRRHSALDMCTPIEYEMLRPTRQPANRHNRHNRQPTRLHQIRGGSKSLRLGDGQRSHCGAAGHADGLWK